jgi:hypothetical protein
LAEELGVEPSPEKARLAERIRAGELAPRHPEPGPAPQPAAAPEPAAAPAGDLIGREADLARVVGLVEGDACGC